MDDLLIWKGNAKRVRAIKKEWIKNNVNVRHYDPYKPSQVDDLTRLMFKSGIIHKSNNMSMILRSTESILVELRREAGIK